MPMYVVAAALAVTLSIPILCFALLLERLPLRRVTRNLNAGPGQGGCPANERCHLGFDPSEAPAWISICAP